MDIKFDVTLADGYKSSSQRIRRLTEGWAENNLYCPRCGYSHLSHFQNNRPVADFYCPNCDSQFELKSEASQIGRKITGGAYFTMINRITSNTNPDFFFMSYLPERYTVNNLIVVPKHFLCPDIIEKRPPLGPTAKRVGWIGCNILLDKIPVQGKIPLILQGIAMDEGLVVKQLSQSSMLEVKNIEARGWLFDVLNCVNSFPEEGFTLSQIYTFTEQLAKKHPDNHNIQAKIRQQLQILRDKGYIDFCARGTYKKLKMFMPSIQ